MVLMKVKRSREVIPVHVGPLEELCSTEWNRRWAQIFNNTYFYLQFPFNAAGTNRTNADWLCFIVMRICVFKDCAPGYTRTGGGLYLGHCELCECNGHSDSCHPETGTCTVWNSRLTLALLCLYRRDGLISKHECFTCQNCLHNSQGEFCEQCAPGFFGDPTVGTPEDCQPCACPHTDPDNQWVLQPRPTPQIANLFKAQNTSVVALFYLAYSRFSRIWYLATLYQNLQSSNVKYYLVFFKLETLFCFWKADIYLRNSEENCL